MTTERILVVEDENTLREELLRVLERRTEFQVLSAASAPEALKLAEKEKFHLLITDVRMPGMDGIELLELLKAKQPDLSAIIITAFADESATIRALKLGANDYLRKPFSIGDFVSAIERQMTILRLRKEADRNRLLLEGLVHSVTAGVLATDENGILSAINIKAREVLALPEDDIALNTLAEQNHPAWLLLQELREGKNNATARELTVHESGLPFTYQLTGTTIVGVDDKHLGHVILLNNVSDIIQAQKMNAWKDLARTVAHEIKNPLTPIKLSAQQIQSAYKSGTDSLEQQLKIATKTIIDNVNRLDNLAREFSRFGRLPQQKMTELDLQNVLIKAGEHFSKRTNIDIILNIENDLPQINGDAESLLRMVENLLSNAVEAMPEGGEIKISLQRHNNSSIKLEISDSGSGISDDVRDQLFMPYITTKSGGTGLGLVIVKEVVTSHNGQIRVESSGEGTNFKITFPAVL